MKLKFIPKSLRYYVRFYTRILLLPACLVCLSVQAIAENTDRQQIDSLLNVLYTSPPMNYNAGFALIDIIQGRSMDTALQTGRQMLQTAKAHSDYNNATMAALVMGDVLMKAGRVDSARFYLHIASDLSKKAGDEEKIECYLYMSRLYEYISKRDSSLYALLQAEEFAQTHKDPSIARKLWPEIGHFYFKQGVYDKALYYLNKCLELHRKTDSTDLASIYSDIGNVYYWQKKYSEALDCYMAAYKNNRFARRKMTYAFVCNNIGLVYHNFGRYDSAKYYYNLSLGYYHAEKNDEGIANLLINLARTNDSLKEYDTGLQNAEDALQLVLKMGKHGYGQLYDVYGIISHLYLKKNKPAEAYHALLQKTAIGDTIRKETSSQSIADIQTRFETAAENAENRALKARNSERNTLLLLIGSVSVLLLIIALILYFYNRRHKKDLDVSMTQNRVIEQKNIEITGQKAELEQANEFRTKLFTIISHDVKEPISTLQSYMNMMRDGMISEEENQMLISELSKSLNVTLAFIENLLAWARLQMEGFKPENHYLDIRENISETLNLYQTKAKDKSLELVNNIEPGLTAYSDKHILEMVMRNLLSNAIKFTPAGGKIVITGKQAGQLVEITVFNTGAAIPGRVKELLFTGKRNSTRGTENESGHGLGLVFCKESLQKSGGDLYLVSSTDEGTRFGFTLPATAYPRNNSR